MLMFLLLGTGGTAKPSRAEERSGYPTETKGYPRAGLADGEIIRLTYRDGTRQEWRLSGATDECLLVIGNPSSPPISIPFADVRTIEQRQNGNPFVGFLAGTLGGCMAGLLLTAGVVELSDDPYAGYWGFMIIPSTLLTGMVGGTILGSQPQWRRVSHEPGLEADGPKLFADDPRRHRPSRTSSPAAVAVGGALGMGAGYLWGANDGGGTPTVAYAMGGLLAGAIVAGIAASRPQEPAEWQKLFAVPQKDGVMVGYHTSF
jgi:hypothetical protein